MSSKRDYYEVLGIAREATLKEIKSAYRKLAVQYHPDRNPGNAEAEAKFKEAAEAYAILSDSEKRERYDRFGHEAAAGAAGFDPTVFSDFSDILGEFFGLGDLFGGRRSRGGARAGADLRYDLKISFEDAAFGTEVTLKIPRLETCESCSGSGSEGGATPVVCKGCGGHGQVRYSQGFFTVARTCPQCRGAGRVISDPCKVCSGEGRKSRERSIQVKIPAGVDTGARLRLAQEGEDGVQGGPPGDLYVVLYVEDHERFVRQGEHVLSSATVSYPQAVLGGRIDVDTVHGPESLEIPAGTQYGDTFRLRGKGVPRLGRSGHGDHIVEVRLEVPEPHQLDEHQLDLLRQLAEAEGSEVKEGRNVLDRVKDLFT